MSSVESGTGVLALLNSAESQKYLKPIGTWFSFFGSKYIANDLQLACGNLLDTSVAKAITLFFIFMPPTNFNVKLAALFTVFMLFIQYMASTMSACRPYRDKLAPNKKVEIRNVVFPYEKGLDMFHKKPNSEKY